MKVRQLMEALSRLDPDMDVVTYVGDFGFDKVSELELLHLAPKRCTDYADFETIEPFMPGAFEAVQIR